MSSKKCPRCGRSYSASYRTCPYCTGRSRRGRSASGGSLQALFASFRGDGQRIFLSCTAFFLMLAILGMILTRCFGAPADPKPSPGNDTDQSGQQEPQPTADPLALSTNLLALTVEESAALTVTGGDEEEEKSWTSSDETVATVENGLVTARGAGTATVTVSSGTQQAMCVVTVKEKDPEVEVYLNRRDFTLSAQSPTFQMEVRERDSRRVYTGSVVWAVENPNVATITADGFVERVGKGNTKITATMGTKVLECIVRCS